MFANFLGRIGAPSLPFSNHEITRAPTLESIDTSMTFDDASNLDSSSTPPTSIGDNVSVTSATPKPEPEPNADDVSIASDEMDRRSKRVRPKVGTYNDKIRSGTAIHIPKKFLKNDGPLDKETRRQTISEGGLEGALGSINTSISFIGKSAQKLVIEGIDALDLSWPVKKLPKSSSDVSPPSSPKSTPTKEDLSQRKSLRSTPSETATKLAKTNLLGESSRKKTRGGLRKEKWELRNLADTKEFAKIETEPVVFEVWSKGKLVPNESVKKKMEAEKAQASQPDPVKAPPTKKGAQGRKGKIWLTMGLYAGQDPTDLNWFKSSSKSKSAFKWTVKPNKVLPMPLWAGQRLLHAGRDFKLPFDICSPLPPGQPKPTEWHKTSHNRFIGEAASMWKKSGLFESFFSKCICNPDTGCDENCQNRIMLYECDDTNCGAGRDSCTNRAFAELYRRRKGNSFKKGGNRYEVGVEVCKTPNRGYGLRSNRCFNANQIIVEYTGEIITEDECDRRMNEDYKGNECYYLMSFDQNMIIDATRGGIARFVNHSCSPNCRMVKWIVGGRPRVALFAGDKPIMTGDELTYDYNFDPFSSKNVQICRCGSDNCRGVLGPRPKDLKITNATTITRVVKAGIEAGKRKLQQMIGYDEDDHDVQILKKRKTEAATGVEQSISTAATNITDTVKKSVSFGLLNTRHVVGLNNNAVEVSCATAGPLKTYGKKKLKTYGKQQMKPSSRRTSLSSSRMSLLFFSPEKNPKAKNDKPSSRESSVSDDGNESSIRDVDDFEEDVKEGDVKEGDVKEED